MAADILNDELSVSTNGSEPSRDEMEAKKTKQS
jgi:hypothetical protein